MLLLWFPVPKLPLVLKVGGAGWAGRKGLSRLIVCCAAMCCAMRCCTNLLPLLTCCLTCPFLQAHDGVELSFHALKPSCCRLAELPYCTA